MKLYIFTEGANSFAFTANFAGWAATSGVHGGIDGMQITRLITGAISSAVRGVLEALRNGSHC